MKNQIQKAQIAICTNKQKHTATGSSAQQNLSTNQQFRATPLLKRGVLMCYRKTHLATIDESIRNWMIQRILKPKNR